MEPNYIQYAQLVNQAGDRTPGLSAIGNTLDTMQTQNRQAAQDARANKLSDLQYKAAETTLNDSAAKQGALQTVYGVTNPQDAYAAQMKADLAIKQKEQSAKEMQTYWGLLDHFDKIGVSDEFKTEYTKKGMALDPKTKDLSEGLTFVSKDKMVVTKPFADGELNDPLTGKPMPAGTYTVEATRTGDPANPYKPIKVEPAKPIQQEKMDEFTVFMNDGRANGKKDGDLIKEWNTIETARKKAGATNVTTSVNTGKVDTTGMETVVKGLPDAKAAAESANSAKQQIVKMKSLLDAGAGGTGGYAKAKVAPLLDAFGISTQGLDDAVLYQTLAKTLGGSMRVEIVGPGPVSNYENELLQKISGGGAQAPGATKELLTFYENKADQKIKSYNTTVDNLAGAAPGTSRFYPKVGTIDAPLNPKPTGKPSARPPLSAIFGTKK